MSDREQLEFRSVIGGALYSSVGPCYPRWLANELVHLLCPHAHLNPGSLSKQRSLEGGPVVQGEEDISVIFIISVEI